MLIDNLGSQNGIQENGDCLNADDFFANGAGVAKCKAISNPSTRLSAFSSRLSASTLVPNRAEG